jgi:predicted acyl esterase
MSSIRAFCSRICFWYWRGLIVVTAFARNPGTGEASGTATALNPVTHTVHHDAAHPSNIVLPVVK